MCDPVTLSIVALSAGSKAMEIKAKNAALKDQQKSAVERQRVMNTQRQMEMEETNRAAGLKLTNAKRDALHQQGVVLAQGAETGTSGGSALRNLGNIYMQSGIAQGSIVSLTGTELAQIGMANTAEFVGTRSAITAAQNSKSTGLQAALQIGMAGVQGYGTGGGFK